MHGGSEAVGHTAISLNLQCFSTKAEARHTQVFDIFVLSSCAGVCHADELIYLFPYTSKFPGTKLTERDEKVVDIMTTLWTNFARTGLVIIPNSLSF
jgi:carboxylesterase type B